jgi:hypothetical protein
MPVISQVHIAEIQKRLTAVVNTKISFSAN